MQKKYQVIESTPQLKDLLPSFTGTGKDSGILGYSSNYAAVGCDLRNPDLLKVVLQEHLQIEDCSVAVLFVAEVSTAYMPMDGSQAVLEWAAGYEDVRFCLLEQHLPDGPDHPFAQTMLKHFEKLRTPLHAIGTINGMRNRFSRAGWPSAGLDIRPLWELWSDPTFLSADQRRALDKVEPFDEWEEFALFASHYFLMVAKKPAPVTSKPADGVDGVSSETSNSTVLVASELQGPQYFRRFAAALTSTDMPETVGLHAGLGTKERLRDTDTYSTQDKASTLAGPPLRAGLMCHTITRLLGSNACLLVGGRTSPDKSSTDCWLRTHGSWERTVPLPEGRYRHSTVSVNCPVRGPGVLLIGGKASDGRVLSEPLLWTRESGWENLIVPDASMAPPARFGAICTAESERSGLLFGGMNDAGTLVYGWWRWRLDVNGLLQWTDITTDIRRQFGELAPLYSRFGAQVTTLNLGEGKGGKTQVIVGGIVGKGMLTRQNEILGLEHGRRFHLEGPRPLMTGHCMFGPLVLGGGATCFSFGTYWSSSSILRVDAEKHDEHTVWRLIGQKDAEEESKPARAARTGSSGQAAGSWTPSPSPVPRVQVVDAAAFDRTLAASKPCIITGADLGACTTKWTNDYLKQAIGPERPVVVHACSKSSMDFQSKNFRYETQTLGSFLDAVEQGGKLYLRALSKDAPSEQPTNLSNDFPEIAKDFSLPPELAHVMQNMHSSPLRVSGPVNMWLHFDTMANVLCQIRGKKRLLLYSPSDVSHLSFAPGASSSSIDVFNADTASHPELQHTHPHEALLEPGDILFIPPLWLHAAAPTEGMSVAVNVFFRSLQSGYAAGRDVYGNRDMAAYEKGRKDVAKIAKAFEDLPVDMSRFYLERLGMELLDKARQGTIS